MSDHKNRLLGHIFKALRDYREGKISHNRMVSSVIGNISAIDGVDEKFENEYEIFAGVIEEIQWTKEEDEIYDAVLYEVEAFEKFLKSYFNIEE